MRRGEDVSSSNKAGKGKRISNLICKNEWCVIDGTFKLWWFQVFSIIYNSMLHKVLGSEDKEVVWSYITEWSANM